jgi:hypothetical protein
MGQWLLSRRDRLTVARHEVPGRSDAESPVPEDRLTVARHEVLGKRCREPRPGGTVEVMVGDIVVETDFIPL